MEKIIADEVVISNLRAFYSIAKEAFEEMKTDLGKNIKPRTDGTKGYIKTIDLKRTSFKKAFITIVFCDVCIDAILYLLIGVKFGPSKADKMSTDNYDRKLKLLGCKDKTLNARCVHVRECRNEIVHERAYSDKSKSQIRIAQDEAEKAIKVLDDICQLFQLKFD